MKKITLILASIIMLGACSNKTSIEPTAETVDVPVETKGPVVENEKVLPDEPYPLITNEPDVELSDEEKAHLNIAERYKTLDMDNVVFEAESEIIDQLINGDSGILFLGNELDDWAQFLIYEVNLAAQATNNKVYLYELYGSELNENDAIIQELSTFLGSSRKLDTPCAIYINNGTLVGYYAVSNEVDKTSTTPTNFYDSDKLMRLEQQLIVFSEKVAK